MQQEQRNGVNAEEFHNLSRQLRDVTERMEVRANPGPPGADRDMTYEEKRKLSVFMGSLDADKLDRVVEIISQDQPELPGKLCHLTLATWNCCLRAVIYLLRNGCASCLRDAFVVLKMLLGPHEPLLHVCCSCHCKVECVLTS